MPSTRRENSILEKLWRVTLLSVVIAALNSENTISQTLSSLYSNNLSSREFEVVVVDNGSTDRTVEVAKRYPVKIFSCAKRGQGAARNMGIAEARGELVCFTDSDIVVPENWLERILEFFNRFPHADGVGGPVLAPASGHLNSLQKLEGETYSQIHNFPKKVSMAEYGNHITSLRSANCAYRKSILLSIDGFDDSGLDAVDTDLCWRLILQGKFLIFNPEIAVLHLGVPWNIKGIFKQQFRWGMSRAILNMRYPTARLVAPSMKGKIYQYFYFVILFSHMIFRKNRRRNILELFEKSAFMLGCINAYLKSYLRF